MCMHSCVLGLRNGTLRVVTTSISGSVSESVYGFDGTPPSRVTVSSASRYSHGDVITMTVSWMNTAGQHSEVPCRSGVIDMSAPSLIGDAFIAGALAHPCNNNQ